MFSRYTYDTIAIHVRYDVSRLRIHTGRYLRPRGKLEPMDGIVFVSSMYRSLITIQYPKCIQRVSKWYRKTIQYRSPYGAKNVSCVYRASIEQNVSRYCIESRIDEITIHVRYTTIHYDTLRYIYGENPPRYMGKKTLFP